MDILWNLFGPVEKLGTNLRPFGNTSVDGFDIDKTLFHHILRCTDRTDNEYKMPVNYDILSLTLRMHFTSDVSK